MLPNILGFGVLRSILSLPAGTCTAACARPTPRCFQHKAERFLPPYFFGTARPVISSISTKELRYGATLTVNYTGTVTGAMLMAPTAVTHQVGDALKAVVVLSCGFCRHMGEDSHIIMTI